MFSENCQPTFGEKSKPELFVSPCDVELKPTVPATKIELFVH
ncbi:hypothetical protein [Flavobacterium psychrophilum]|nr:hypothetical protein [Flavobacterium psychrophilum]